MFLNELGMGSPSENKENLQEQLKERSRTNRKIRHKRKKIIEELLYFDKPKDD